MVGELFQQACIQLERDEKSTIFTAKSIPPTSSS